MYTYKNRCKHNVYNENEMLTSCIHYTRDVSNLRQEVSKIAHLVLLVHASPSTQRSVRRTNSAEDVQAQEFSCREIVETYDPTTSAGGCA